MREFLPKSSLSRLPMWLDMKFSSLHRKISSSVHGVLSSSCNVLNSDFAIVNLDFSTQTPRFLSVARILRVW